MRSLLYSVLAVSLFFSCVILMTRHHTEKQVRRVELALDLKDTKELSFITGKKLSDVLHRFRQEGVTSVAVAETTFSELVDEGQTVESPGSALPRFKMDGKQSAKIKKFAWLK